MHLIGYNARLHVIRILTETNLTHFHEENLLKHPMAFILFVTVATNLLIVAIATACSFLV